MLGVDLRHHHGYIIRPAVGGVVGDDGALQLGIFLLQGPDVLFLHIHGAEAEIHHACQLFGVGFGVQNHQILRLFRQGNVQRPAAFYRFSISLSSATAAGGDGGQLEPGMVFHQRDEPLSHHAGAANDANFVLFHDMFLLLL